MIIIGEKINTSIKAIQAAVESWDKSIIQDIALKQVENGADYLDINCGTFINDEPEKIKWLIDTVLEVINVNICIDSPNPKAIEAGLEAAKTIKPIINSITAEKERWSSILPLVSEYKTSIIALCMDDTGISSDSDQRLKIAVRIAEEIAKKGLKLEDIYFDPMVQPISVDTQNALITLETMKKIKKELPQSHIICGLSNISYGLPARKLLNQTFMVSSIFYGLDAAIINPLDKKLMALIYSAEAVAGKDEYCMKYIDKYRNGFLEI